MKVMPQPGQWIPACAGMTITYRLSYLRRQVTIIVGGTVDEGDAAARAMDSRLRGNDDHI